MNNIWTSGLLLAVLWGVGCDVVTDSGTNTGTSGASNPGGYSGNYTNDGQPVVERSAGPVITSLQVIQSGSNLTVIDNTGAVYRGSVVVVEGSASAQWSGTGSVGQAVRFTGVFSSGSGTNSLRGTWIEPSLSSRVIGSAAAPQKTTAGGDDSGGEGGGSGAGGDDSGEGGGGDDSGDGGGSGGGAGGSKPPWWGGGGGVPPPPPLPGG